MADVNIVQRILEGMEDSNKWIIENISKLAQESDKKNQEKIRELTDSIQGMQSEIKRRFQGIEDTLGSVRKNQSILNDTLAVLPEKIQGVVIASIDRIVQDRVAKALAAQMPKMIEAVQQQLGKSPQNEGKESATQPNPTEKPAGERYADHEMVEKPMPRGVRKRLQAMTQAFRSGARSKEELFQTEAGMLSKFKDGFIGRLEDLKSGAWVYDVASENGSVHALEEGSEAVKKATYRSDGQSSYGVVGHRANVVDKLDEKDKDGKGLTLEEKKEIVRQYRQEHPKGGGR